MHLTDDQLNEYLDNESAERAAIETHLSSCDECAARLTALQALFTEIESLPELALSQSIAARFTTTSSLPPQLPRWLTLTATLQAVAAVVAIIFVAPFVANLFPAIQTPSIAETLLHLQSHWMALLKTLTDFQLPTLPQIPVIETSSLMLALTLAGVSLLWLVGNGFLLRSQMK
ncbi:MAG: hypothetical protein IPP66_10910 [Anaerolineales bacterium]|nr:hypothetical protein [Anaerolineales bacterium]